MLVFLINFFSINGFAATPQSIRLEPTTSVTPHGFTPVDQSPYFDIPVTYNRKVSKWIKFYQSSGKKWFSTWLGRSHRYLPRMKDVMMEKGLPQDLAYIAMIESGFSPNAVSTANAVGYWQFIDSTGERYGLRKNWWLDERRDYLRSTEAAAKYLGDLYKMFDSWYLTACAYNMGENRLKRLINKYQTRNFWNLAREKDFPEETREYIPKLIASVLIAKMPKLYGFDEIIPAAPLNFETYYAPGGTDLINLAKFLGVPGEAMQRLNPALTRSFVPKSEKGYWIRIPNGQSRQVAKYVELQN